MRSDSQKYRFLELVGVSGEFPASLVKRIPGKARFKRKYIDDLKGSEMISVYSRNGMKGYRLTKQAKKMLLEMNPSRFDFYLKGNVDTSMVRVSPERRTRLHRMAEAAVLMSNAGVRLYRDEKPYLFDPAKGIHDAEIHEPAYYNMREVKEIGLEYLKIKNSRSTGALILPDEVYIVYSLGPGLINWFKNSEERCQYVLAETLTGYGIYSGPVVPKALVVGNSMEVMVRIVEESRKRKSPFNILTGTYNSMAFVPNTQDGDTLLKLLCSRKMRRSLDNALLSNFSKASTGREVIECDAVDRTGNPALFAYDCDLARISRFLTALQINGWTGSLVCFDYQLETFRRLYGGVAEILAIDWTAFRQEFNL